MQNTSKFRKYGQIALLAVALLSPSQRPSQSFKYELPDVPEGTIAHIQGPSQARGFYECSAVILDYGNEALFAHATSGLETYGGPRENPREVNVGNVIPRMLQEAQRTGLDNRPCFAVVNAGSPESLERITSDLISNGIQIKSSNMNFAPTSNSRQPRTILYDPANDLLDVSPQ